MHRFVLELLAGSLEVSPNLILNSPSDDDQKLLGAVAYRFMLYLSCTPVFSLFTFDAFGNNRCCRMR